MKKILFPIRALRRFPFGFNPTDKSIAILKAVMFV
jgi:hypothetical protein